MYTQCPECKAVFEVAATDLAVAGGFVRCGQCSKSFDALNSLTDITPEELTAEELAPEEIAVEESVAEEFAVEESLPEAIAVEESVPEEVSVEDIAPATSANDPETDSIKKTAHAEKIFSAMKIDALKNDSPDIEEIEAEEKSDDRPHAALAATDDEPAETTPETTVAADADDDDEILLDESYQPPEVDEEEDYEDDWLQVSEKDDASDADEAASGDDEPVDEIEDFFDDTDDSESLTDVEEPETDEDAVDESALFTLPLPELTSLDRDVRDTFPEKLEGGEAAHDPSAQAGVQPGYGAIEQPVVQAKTTRLRANDAFDAEDARDLKDYLNAPASRIETAAWGTGAALMAMLLIGQLVHRNRGDLVIHPRLGPIVSSMYETIGVDLRPNWRIADYKVVGQARIFQMPPEETGAADTTALRFVAIISNGAELPQPAPMVRLTLRDRWGDPTGVRDFTPPEYLADRGLIGQLLEPGQRLRVVLNLHDPGTAVVGFDFDMCLPDAAGTLRCSNEPVS